MSVKYKYSYKTTAEIFRTTAEIIPFLDAWLVGQDETIYPKVKENIWGAAVDKRYSMDPLEVLPILHLKNAMIFTLEVIDLGEKVLQKH
jgi:hypothetical protein